jgi:suppressor for copper-sensitivity B
MPRPSTRAAALAALAASALAAPAAAEPGASPWQETRQTGVRLIAAGETLGDARAGGPPAVLGLHFKLAKGWKIYWRSPGDAGYPPRPDWTLSTNAAKIELAWPAPERFSVLGFETLGYKDEVVLPLHVTPAADDRPLVLRGAVDYLTCDDICIPYRAEVALALPPGPPRPTPFAHLINRYSSRVPGAAHGIGIERAEAANRDGGLVLGVHAASSLPFSSPDVFVEGPPELSFGKPKVALSEGGARAMFEVAVYGANDLAGGVVGRSLTFTLVDGQRAAEKAVRVEPGAPGGVADAAPAPSPLPAILALALLGGLILNLMPCVLPVLSLKVLGVVGHGGGRGPRVRASFLASSAGIVFSFLALAAALAALKAAGAEIGWGIQFQQPWFLAAMAAVVVVFACNLWGLFEIRLPRALAGMGAGLAHVKGLGGDFLTGALATLLATPCSAPFVGTAVGFALARGTPEIFAVFAALGLGLALPYLGLAAAPGLATRLPKPGPWMAALRRALGLALALTGLWLLSVLAQQVGSLAALTSGLFLAAAALALLLRRRVPDFFGGVGLAATAVALVFAVALPTAVAPAQNSRPAPAAAPDGQAGGRLKRLWAPFDEARIGALVAEGRLVFVDVTADWCITCQVNKTFVLGADGIVERLAAPGVVAMQADWTLPDAAISRYLARFGRYGIPFNAVYGPAAPQGIALPELLTRDAVLAALDKAGAKKAVSQR